MFTITQKAPKVLGVESNAENRLGPFLLMHWLNVYWSPVTGHINSLVQSFEFLSSGSVGDVSTCEEATGKQ